MILGKFAIGGSEDTFILDKRISLKEGLSQGRVLSILEDRRGFMWFGTADGLNRFDGYSTKIYRNINNDSTSLPNNTINTLIEDSSGIIWIGTLNGIARFDPYKEEFSTIRNNDSASIELGVNKITSSAIDMDQNLWFGTDGYGIVKINPNNYKTKYYLKNSNTNDLSRVAYLFFDSQKRLWIGSFTDNHAYYFDIEKETFKKHLLNSIEVRNNNSYKINSFYEDNENRVWCNLVDYDSTFGCIFYLGENDTVFNNYKHYISKETLSEYKYQINSISAITGDNTGNICFSSVLGGIFKFRFGSNLDAFFQKAPGLDPAINCLNFASNELIWIGTNGNGIELLPLENTVFHLYNNQTNSNFSIKSIRTIVEDDNYYWVGGYNGLAKILKDFSYTEMIDDASVYIIAECTNNKNILWSGSEGGGLETINKLKGELNKTKFRTNDENAEYLNHIYCIHQLHDTLLLLGTHYGLYGFNPNDNLTYKFPFNSDGTYDKSVRSITIDGSNNVIVGYVQGSMGILDLKDRKVIPSESLPKIHTIHEFNPINCIYIEDKFKYWIATPNGLILANMNSGSIKYFTEKDGLPNSHIYGILPDKEGNLWLSTNNGISCFSPLNSSFINYDVSDGLQNNEFNTGAYFKASNGDLFFGGINGFNYFNPNQIKQNSIVPKVEITGIKLGNEYLNLTKNEILTSSIKIPSNKDFFTVEFAGLSFINSTKNQYKYRIQEISNHWIDLGSQHQITFTNIDPGKYTLEILASNNHGLWVKNPFELTFDVIPKYYESATFKWIMTIFVIILVIIGIRIRLYQITKQKNRLESLVSEQTNTLVKTNSRLQKEVIQHSKTSEDLIASNNTKDKFLSIIAHDLIGPLSVILGFSDLLIDQENEFSEIEKKSFYKTINITTKGLLSLLTNLLQWSKLQSGSMKSSPVKLGLKNSIDEVISLFRGNLKEKDLNLNNQTNSDIFVYADKNMLSTILRNLISNAIKFTPTEGNITIDSILKNKMIEISIKDTGIGIDKANIKKLFNAESNFTTKGTNNEAGTGLGLGLASEFVIYSGGKLWLESEVGQGTIFYFTLPTIQ